MVLNNFSLVFVFNYFVYQEQSTLLVIYLNEMEF